MKPCAKNRKLIAWLTLGSLEPKSAQVLRAHLETCAGCREYLAELSSTAQSLEEAQPKTHIRASEAFHQRLARAIAAEPSRPNRGSLASLLRGAITDWRVAVPTFGAAAAAVLLFSSMLTRPPQTLPPTSPSSAPRSTTDSSPIPAPSLANYQRVANHSLEEFDELLTRQGNRSPVPARLYTASLTTLAKLTD